MSIKEDLKIPLTMLSISFLDKLPYKGSYKGMRFIFEKNKNDSGENILKLYTWKDLYNFENTKKEDMEEKCFTYDKTGIEEGINYLDSKLN